MSLSTELEVSAPGAGRAEMAARLEVLLVPPAGGSLSASGEAWEAERLPLSSEQPRSFLGVGAAASCHVARARRSTG